MNFHTPPPTNEPLREVLLMHSQVEDYHRYMKDGYYDAAINSLTGLKKTIEEVTQAASKLSNTIGEHTEPFWATLYKQSKGQYGRPQVFTPIVSVPDPVEEESSEPFPQPATIDETIYPEDGTAQESQPYDRAVNESDDTADRIKTSKKQKYKW